MKLFMIILLLALRCGSIEMNRKPLSHAEDKIVYKLVAKEDFRIDEPVKVQFILENRSDEALFFLKWYTPFEGFNSDMFIVTCNGRVIQYEGRMIKRGNPGLKDYLSVDPGNSLNAEVELSLVYNMKDTGNYRIEYKSAIRDFIFLNKAQKPENYLPVVPGKEQKMDIKGNLLNLKVEML
jgi:hypothetical protein